MSNSNLKNLPMETPPLSHNPNIRPHTAPLTLKYIESNIIKILQTAKTFEQEHPDKRDALTSVFHRLFKGLSEKWPHLLPTSPPPKQTAVDAELKRVNETLATLQKTILTMQNQLTPSTPDTATPHQTTQNIPAPTLAPITTVPASSPAPKKPTKPSPTPNTYANTLTSPPRPSIIIHTMIGDHTEHTPPHTLCNAINNSLKHSALLHVHISAARWTTKGNIVLTGGHSNTLQHLTSASNMISSTITSSFPLIHEHLGTATPHITANIRWSKVLLSNIPTGADEKRGPWTPEECHKVLITDNPRYAELNITQRPSWVKHPDTYKTNSSSSLVFAFEDPEGHNIRSLLKSEKLYIFGTGATVKPWQQQPPLSRQTRHTEPQE